MTALGICFIYVVLYCTGTNPRLRIFLVHRALLKCAPVDLYLLLLILVDVVSYTSIFIKSLLSYLCYHMCKKHKLIYRKSLGTMYLSIQLLQHMISSGYNFKKGGIRTVEYFHFCDTGGHKIPLQAR
jgi:hypothetical protein